MQCPSPSLIVGGEGTNCPPVPTSLCYEPFCWPRMLPCTFVSCFEVGVGKNKFKRCTETYKSLTIIYFTKAILPNATHQALMSHIKTKKSPLEFFNGMCKIFIKCYFSLIWHWNIHCYKGWIFLLQQKSSWFQDLLQPRTLQLNVASTLVQWAHHVVTLLPVVSHCVANRNKVYLFQDSSFI